MGVFIYWNTEISGGKSQVQRTTKKMCHLKARGRWGGGVRKTSMQRVLKPANENINIVRENTFLQDMTPWHSTVGLQRQCSIKSVLHHVSNHSSDAVVLIVQTSNGMLSLRIRRSMTAWHLENISAKRHRGMDRWDLPPPPAVPA